MAVPEVIAEFVAGLQASADYNSGIRAPLLYLMQTAPLCIARATPSLTLTQGIFTEVTFDGSVETDNGMLAGGVVTAPDAGVIVAVASLRSSNVRGNKELRISRNGLFDDGDPWASAQNQFGVATPAFSSTIGAGGAVCEAGDTMSVGLFVDTPEDAVVLDGVICAFWIRSANVIL